MDDVKSPPGEDVPYGLRLEEGVSSLLGCQWREQPPAAAKGMNPDIRVIRHSLCRLSTRKGPVGIGAVDDFDVMTSHRQRVGQAIDVCCIPTKTVGRIEGGNHAEI